MDATPGDSGNELNERYLSQLLRLLLDQEQYGVALLHGEAAGYRYDYVNPTFQSLRPSLPMIGRLVQEVWPERAVETQQEMREVELTGQPWVRFNQPIRVEGSAEGESGRRYVTVYMRALHFAGKTYIATTFRDVSPEVDAARSAAAAQRDLARSEGLMREQERESRVLQGANQILEAAIGAESEEALGEVCLRVAEQVTGSSLGFISELSEDGKLEDIASSDTGAENVHRIPPSGSRIAGLYGKVLTSGNTLYTNQPDVHPDRIDLPDGHPPLENFLGVPLKRADRVVGLVAVANRQGGYDPEIVALLEDLAPSIATALHSYRSTQQLMESTQLLQAHMTNSPLAIIEFDTELRITRWSGSAEQVFGWRADEVLGRPLTEVPWVYEPDAELVAAESARLHSGTIRSSRNVNRNVRKDGQVIWCEWYSSALHDANGQLTSVFSQVLDITERREAQKRLQLQASRVELLKHIAEVAASALDLKELGERMSQSVAEATGAKMSSVVLSVQGRVQPVAISWGCSQEFTDAMHSLPPSQAALARDRVGGMYIGDAEQGELGDAMREVFRRAGVASLAWVPLLIEGKPTGGLGLAWGDSHDFGEDEISFLQSLAGEMSVGLQNAMLYEGERAQRRRIQELHGVLEAAVAAADAHEVADQVLGYLAGRRTFDLGAVWLARGDSLELMATFNYPPSYAERLSPLPISEPYDVPAVFLSGVTVVQPDAAQAPEAVRELYESLGMEIGAYVVVPLRSRGANVGALTLAWHKPRAIDEGDVGFYEAIGGEVGVVLRNRELLRAVMLDGRYAEALNRVNEAVHSTLEFAEIMRRVVVEATEAAGFDVALVHLREAEGWRVAYVYGIPDDVRDVRATDDESPSSMWVLQHGQPLVVSKSKGGAPAWQLMDRLGVSSMLGLPLVARGERIGVLYTGRRGEERAFEQRQIDFMRKVASTVSLALENARLYDAERTIADRLQTALLTLPESVPGIEFAHAYHSATEAARVGGDFYDLFEIGEDRLGIVIGDVAGKGIDAAVLTSMVKNTLRAHASTPGSSLSHALELTNDVVFKSTPVESFVTVFIGVLSPSDGSLRYASAGHTEGNVVRPGGESRPLRVTGPLLGAFPGVHYEQSEAFLDVSDLLFLYTDGVIEARRGNDLFGETRLRDALARFASADVRAVVEDVVGEVVSFAGGRLTDDLAILAIRRSPAIAD